MAEQTDAGLGVVFMRCNVEHHGMGVARGPRAELNHSAWGVENLATLGALGGVLARSNGRFIWARVATAPARRDERTYEAGRWSLEDPRFSTLWGSGPPVEMMETATPLAS